MACRIRTASFLTPAIRSLSFNQVRSTHSRYKHENAQFFRRHRNIKPWPVGPKEDWKKGICNYEWRTLRGKKVFKPKLPDFEAMRKETTGNLSIEEMRSLMKERGVVPHRSWNEKPIFIGSTTEIMDPYVPSEGDGKTSSLNPKGMYSLVGRKGKSTLAVRKLRRYIEQFDPPTFAEEALQIYIKAHQAIADRDEITLLSLATDLCFPAMMHQFNLKTVKWQFIKQLERPVVVQVRVQEILEKSNQFAQVTVRLHTQQILAVYDRFGRLMHGSEAAVKDVLEYVVFENHLSNEYGVWKIHAKIIPDQKHQREPIRTTFKTPPIIDTVEKPKSEDGEKSSGEKESLKV